MLSMKTIAMMCAEVVDCLGDTGKLPKVMYGVLYALKDAGELSSVQIERFTSCVVSARSTPEGVASIIDNNPSWKE